MQGRRTLLLFFQKPIPGKETSSPLTCSRYRTSPNPWGILVNVSQSRDSISPEPAGPVIMNGHCERGNTESAMCDACHSPLSVWTLGLCQGVELRSRCAEGQGIGKTSLKCEDLQHDVSPKK
jgi:hypothetical protein